MERKLNWDQPRRLIADGLERMGLSLNDASKRMGRNSAYLSQYMNGRPKALREDDRRAIAALLGIDEQILAHGRHIDSISEVDKLVRPTRGRVGLRDLPMWPASTKGEVDGGRALPSAFVPRIETLLGNSEAWAAKVLDDGLAPCLTRGDTCFFDPLDPPTAGDIICVVQETKGSRGRERRLGLFCDMSKDTLTLRPCVSAETKSTTIILQPHMIVGRMVGMLRR